MTRTAREIRMILVSLGIECPEEIAIRRLRPGHWMRSSGAWSWVATPIGDRHNLIAGSPDPCRALIRASRHGQVYRSKPDEISAEETP